jgi:DNA excision repair protein ERCC-3
MSHKGNGRGGAAGALASADASHLERLSKEPWGLVIYDEVHVLPAPVFRFTAAIQATRRLELTATLVREDRREDDVFTLIGPKRYDMPWRELEEKRWIAQAFLREIRVAMPAERLASYLEAAGHDRHRTAAENPAKLAAVENLLARHRGEPALIIGQYLRQLREVAERFEAPILTGQTPLSERTRLYDAFRAGELPILVVSRVANFAIDLPQASVAIEVSGTFGSRQEEAQRLGRVLRPKGRPSYFYAVVSADTVEQDFSWNRQRFLTEQGYEYEVEDFGAAKD